MLATYVSSQEVVALPALPLNSDVVFLCDFDGTDFAQTAVDRSPKNASILFSNGAHLDVLIKKFGTASYANSTARANSGVRVPADVDYTLITGNFTVEAFDYSPGSFTYTTVIAGVFGSGTNFAQSQWAFQITNTSIRFSVFGASPRDYCVCNHGMVSGQFYHIAVCRTNFTIRIFINGVMVGKDVFLVRSITPAVSTIGLSIGCDWDLFTTYVNQGNLDAVRITKASWYQTDANFTPPEAPFGTLAPSLVTDTDVFYPARSNPYTLAPSYVAADDSFPTVTVSPQTLSPGLVASDDVILVPSVHIANTWDTSFSTCALSGNNLIATNNQGTSTAAGCIVELTPGGRNSGLVYYEIKATSVGGANYGLGVVVRSFNYSPFGADGTGGLIFMNGGHIWREGVDLGAIMPAMTSGDVYGFALHLGRRLQWIKKVSGTPGNWNNSPTADPTAALGGITIPAGTFVVPTCTLGGAGGSGSDIITGNFGQSAFVGVVPTGYEHGYVGGI